MTSFGMVRRLTAGVLSVLFIASAIVRATPPADLSVFQQNVDIKKLPPVNWVRSRTIDVKHVDIDLRFDWDREQAIGSTTVTLAPFADTEKVYLDAAEMSIDGVSLVGGGELKFNYDGKKDGDNLEILLGRIYSAGRDIKVKVDYKTHYVNVADNDTSLGGFGKGLRFIKPTADNPTKPRQVWSQGESEFNRYWFPSYDSPNDFRTQDLKATVQKPFFVVSNGQLTETKENGDGTRTFHWVMNQPFANYLTSIVVGETTPVEQKFEDIPVYNYGYVNETKEVAATTKNLPATMAFFSQVTGVKYPYAKYSQAFVEEFGGGMENITATTQIEEMIHDERELLDTDSEGLQSHELAHQWFGDYVTTRDWGQIWLNESFATYMQAMWTQNFKGHEEFLYTDIRGNQNTVINTWNNGNRRPIVTKYYANKDALFDSYAYPGGASVLHMIRRMVGDTAFRKALNHYLVSHAHQPVSTEDLRIAFEESTGQSVDWFFDQWLYKMGHPIFEVTQSYAGGKLTLNVKQTQAIDVNNEYPQTAYFQGPIDVEIDNKVSSVWLEPKAENVFTFDSASQPKLVNFDYESTWLKELKFEKSTDDLLFQMQNDKDVLGRRWAMAELAKKAKAGTDRERITAAFIVSAEKDPFWRIRRAALSEVAGVFSPDPPPGQERPAAKLDAASEALALRLAKDPRSLIRGDAIELLGETQDKKYVDTYIAALNDQSYTVIEQAANALGLTRDPRGYEPLLKLTSTPSWRNRIMAAGLNGLSELGDKRAFDTAYRIATDKTLKPNLRTAALTVIGATGKGDPRAYPLIFERFKPAVASNSFQAIFNGVQAIIKLGDPRGQEAFDLLREHFKGQNGPLQAIANWEAQFKAAINQ